MKNLEEIFQCTMCGYCCQGETTVSLNEEDRTQITQALDIELDELTCRYLRETNNIYQMKTENGYCIFYDNGCSLHPHSPWQCRQWPFHPAILKDENNFKTIQSSCPGIKKTATYKDVCKYIKHVKANGSKVIC